MSKKMKEKDGEKLKRLVRLSHQRGEMQALSKDIPIYLDEEISKLTSYLEEKLWILEDLDN